MLMYTRIHGEDQIAVIAVLYIVDLCRERKRVIEMETEITRERGGEREREREKGDDMEMDILA